MKRAGNSHKDIQKVILGRENSNCKGFGSRGVPEIFKDLMEMHSTWRRDVGISLKRYRVANLRKPCFLFSKTVIKRMLFA